ncbi:hypothetical protein ASG17_10645 [Brevundimonas sp. Leaf363]|uniref:hypothetical protein n=1 Tax=Brevundimonas sp. Leaf363 TaxID=1736353 RepID=UPI0006F575D5|nr:hypothetical protein [Brevundimonas sp. Leaf363]KQS56439.1 hypothetical protein ASG17_10645 [Brevundimonas sp. Leaf363]
MVRGTEHRRRLKVGAALSDGLGAVPRLWAGAWGVLLFAVMLALIAPWVPHGFGSVVYGLGSGLAMLAAWGALCRLAATPDRAAAERAGLRAGGFQLGKLEARIVFAAFLNLLFLSMILVVLALVVLAIFGMATALDLEALRARNWAAAGPAWQLAMIAAVAAIAVTVPILLAVRLALFSQATAGRGYTVSLNTMGIATGSFWPLLAVITVAILPMALLMAAVVSGVPYAGHPAVVAAVLAWVQAPVAAGVLGAAYRQLEYWAPA